jgi:hypothetical protein
MVVTPAKISKVDIFIPPYTLKYSNFDNQDFLNFSALSYTNITSHRLSKLITCLQLCMEVYPLWVIMALSWATIKAFSTQNNDLK